MHLLNAKEKLNENDTIILRTFFDQIGETTSHKIASVKPLISHLKKTSKWGTTGEIKANSYTILSTDTYA